MKKKQQTQGMVRRIQALVLAAVMLLSTAAMVLTDRMPVKADGELILKLHYHRDDGAYDGWSVWMWPEGGDGADYALADEDGEMVATMEVTPGTTSVGFIVRTADWAKDVDADQFIDISEMVSGTVHIYVESTVEGYTKELGSDAVTGVKLKTATYNGDGTIAVAMTGALSGDMNAAYSVRGKEETVEVSSVEEGADFVYTVTLAAPLDNTKSYFITYDGTEYSVIMPIIYSTKEFEDAYTYDGDDLGAVWSESATTFRLWAPTAEEAYVNLYEGGTAGEDDQIEKLPMTADVNGTWTVTKDGNLDKTYYTFTVVQDEVEQEACDPYARTTGVNGQRAMVINLAATNPEGWEEDKNPHAGERITDAVIYELHMRDVGAHKSAGIEHVGKFLGLTESGTKTSGGVPTGVDHIKDLGITHLHLLPIYDFGSVDETKNFEGVYNWGYDPVNYNVPEGSYSTDPYNGEVRVAEMKQMIQSLHGNGISVVMDVVYNHVYNTTEFCFNKLVPGYFSRINDDGTNSNGSGCGNDTASERSMVKKYIVDSVCYWADEYHIDGFRFDLVGLLDIETVNAIVEEVHKNHPDVIFYGEGWTLNTNVTKDGYELATQTNSEKTPGFAYFNDNLRDALKGNVFNSTEKGYVSGAMGQAGFVSDCFLGNAPWCHTPSQTINYASCHDNLTLFDRLQTSNPDASLEDLIRMNNLAAAIYMTSEGVPFIMAGEELLRTKKNSDGTLNENSYAAGDMVNAIAWSDLEDPQYAAVNDYYKGLIAFRKAHGALRLDNAEDVAANVTPVTGLDSDVLAYDIKGGEDGEAADEIFVIFNPNESETTVALPEGSWSVCVNEEKAGTEVLDTVSENATVAPVSAMVLVRGKTTGSTSSSGASSSDGASSSGGTASTVLLVLGCLFALCAAAWAISKNVKKKG